jgi:hypothetical protein
MQYHTPAGLNYACNAKEFAHASGNRGVRQGRRFCKKQAHRAERRFAKQLARVS